MSDFNSLVQYTVENISRPVKYIIYKLTEFIRVVAKFVFRQVPSGAASGYATIEQIEGNTVAWNQLISNSYTPSLQIGSGVTLTNNGDGTYTANGTASGQVRYRFLFTLPRGHVILVKDDKIENGSLSTYFINFSEPTATSMYTRGGSLGITTLNNNNVNFQLLIQNGVTVTNLTIRPQLFDLTRIFGAGNEPTTVADFEAWREQNGLPSVADYNAGELLSVKMSGMQTEDSSQQTLDTIALDVTTITGINPNTNTREVMFADGMCLNNDGYQDILIIKDDIQGIYNEAQKSCEYKLLPSLDGWVKGIPEVNHWYFQVAVDNLCNYDPSDLSSILCNNYETRIATISSGYDTGISTYTQAGVSYIRVYDERYSTVDAFLAANSTTAVIYSLEEPIIYTEVENEFGQPLSSSNRYNIQIGGTEMVLPQNTSTPTTVAPTLTTVYTKDVH